MKTILYLVTEDWYFWSHRRMLAKQAMEEGYNIIVVTSDGNYAKAIQEYGMTLIPFIMERSVSYPLAELRTIRQLIKVYKETRPDIVHHISLKPILIGSIAAWIVKVPRVINSYTGLGYMFIKHSWISLSFRSFVVPLLSILFKQKKFYAIVQNRDDEELLRHNGLIKEDRYTLIKGSGVDTSVFKFIPEKETDCPVVLFAARLLRDKGIYEYVEACRILKTRNIKAKFVVAGDIDTGNPTSVSRQELNGWIEEQLIAWLGFREDMQNVIKDANIVCLPSYREGMPKILLEAAAVGRAIITTDVPGCRDCVSDEENGLLVPAGDSASLANAIQQLINAPGTRITMGKAGQEMIRYGFDIDTVNYQTIQLYNTLLSC